MFAEFQRQLLLKLSHRLIVLGKKLQGAADKSIPEKRLFLLDCEEAGWRNVRPCFVLSTGRTGTLLLNKILEQSPDAMPLHEPQPELFRASRLAYEQIEQKPEIFREVFKSAREEYLLKAARQERIYIETNNQITFFAPIIRDVFPNAIFVHLVRHPADFVRSGVRRKWYAGHSHDLGRIVPLAGQVENKWPEMSAIEKIGWLWNETNLFIENFLETLPAADYLQVKSEALFHEVEASKSVYEFTGLTGFLEKKVSRILSTPQNAQRKGDFPLYAAWQQSDKDELKRMATLSDKYEYQL